ncbi:MAG: beta-ketoacyl-[acyl-carrier-protein] synthase family protein, partial [Thermoanaerobaculia bacterium]|nr:beta-ketoacyl-[acyl-carrier-protein] synthase family protein [Thermoanaerobaculia bacterium]
DVTIRLAVTGLGIYCAIGKNQSEVWDSIVAGRDGIGPLDMFPGETFPTDIAAQAELDPFVPSGFPRSEAQRLSRTDLFGIRAAGECWAQATPKGSPIAPRRVVVSSGTSTGGLLEGEEWFMRRERVGALRAAPSSVLQQPTSGSSDAIARHLGLGGGVFSNATACASGGAAIGLAADLLRSGLADAAIAGGTDALCRLTYSGFNVLQAVDSKPCRPFDAARQGITLGEGAAYVVIERWDDALARGAEILAELCGYGASCDASHPTAPAEDGRGARAAMLGAIRDGRAEGLPIDYVNAHGTGTLLNDSAETNGIIGAVGTGVPVSSTKSYFGHTLGAAGGLEAVIAILALRHQLAPPTLRLETPAEDCTLDYIPKEPRPMHLERVLSNTFGFGGSNVSLLFRVV